MATAKLEHHFQKLHDRVTEICNILSDIGATVDPKVSTAGAPDKIDYTVPFCVGDENYKLYTIIDGETLQLLKITSKKDKKNNGRGGLIDGISEVAY